MATALARRRTAAPIIVTMPTRRRSPARRRVTAVARRARRSVGRVAREGAVPTSMLLGSSALGYAQAKGWLNRIPTIGGSRALTLGIAGYAATKLTGNRHVRMVGRVAMLIGAFDFGSKQGGGKSALEGDDSEWLEGDDDDEIDGDDDDEI